MNNILELRPGRNRGNLNSSPDLCWVETEDIRTAVPIFLSRNRGYLNSSLGLRSGTDREEGQVGIEDI